MKLKFLFIFAFTQIAVFASYADSGKRERVDFSVSEEQGVYSVTVSFPADVKMDRFALPGPNRVVLDLIGLSSPRNRTYPLPNNPAIERIRVGAHDEKCRIVLDLTGSNTPMYSVEESYGAVTLKFKGTGDSQGQSQRSMSARVTRVLPAQKEEVSAPALALATEPEKVIPKIVDVAALQPTARYTESELLFPDIPRARLKNDPVDQTAISPEPLVGQKILSIDFISGATPAVRIAMTQPPEYMFSRQSPELYRLVISDASFSDERQLLPLFPNMDFEGLRFLKPEHSSSQASIAFGTDTGVRLLAVTRGNEILITVSADSPALGSANKDPL